MDEQLIGLDCFDFEWLSISAYCIYHKSNTHDTFIHFIIISIHWTIYSLSYKSSK